MHGHINVKSPNNINKWQMGFNSAFKGLRNKWWETDGTEFAFHLLFMSNWCLDRSCCVENCEVSKVAIFQNVPKFGCHCWLTQNFTFSTIWSCCYIKGAPHDCVWDVEMQGSVQIVEARMAGSQLWRVGVFTHAKRVVSFAGRKAFDKSIGNDWRN